MRVVSEYLVPGLDQMIGREPRLVLRFSEAEKKALRRAADIADQARKLWRESVEYDVECETMDDELALIGCHVDEVIDGIEL